MSVESCPFCRIVRGDLSAEIIHRDDIVVAFRDIRPVAPVHILIVPALHLATLEEIQPSDGGLLDHMAQTARVIAIGEHVNASGYRLVINTGGDAGQSVLHLHMHLLAGRRMSWPPG